MLYRRTGSRYWWMRFTGPDGCDIRQSTGTDDKREAEEYEAKVKHDRWRQSRLGDKPRYTWQAAVVRYLGEMKPGKGYDDIVYQLRWLDPHLNGKTLDQIDEDAIVTLMDKRQADGVTNATVNRMAALVRSILKRAERRWRWIDRAPSVTMLPEPSRRIRWLTREEAERLLAALPDHMADMARFALATGLRESNVTLLEWSQVDLDRRLAWIHADQAKGKRAIGVPLNNDAVLVLRRCQGRHPSRVFCWPRPRGKGRIEWTPVRRADHATFKKGLVRAGIHNFRWHDLRHTWASWHIQAGTPLHILQELGGWATLAMVQRYAHLSSEHLAAHAARIATGIRSVPSCTLSGTAEQEQLANAS